MYFALPPAIIYSPSVVKHNDRKDLILIIEMLNLYLNLIEAAANNSYFPNWDFFAVILSVSLRE